MHRTIPMSKVLLAVALAALAPRLARADEATPAVEQAAAPALKEPSLLVGVRVGGAFPQAFNKLDTTFLLDVEVGLQLPFFHHRFGLYADGSYAQPTANGTLTTPQVGGPVDYKLTQEDIGLALGVKYLHFVAPRWPIYLGAGVKFHFTRNVIDQSVGGTDLGENIEDSTRIGAEARAGFGYRVGPGMLQIEIHYEYTPIKQLITGDENTSLLAAQLGYTFFAL